MAAVGAQVSWSNRRRWRVGRVHPQRSGGQRASQSIEGGRCTPQQIGADVTVVYDTANLPGGGVLVRIPFISDMVLMTPVIKASFRCEA